MTTILSKPVESITKADLDSVIGWPEGERLEFKKDLPSNKFGSMTGAKAGGG